jgi:hypothetical protein
MGVARESRGAALWGKVPRIIDQRQQEDEEEEREEHQQEQCQQGLCRGPKVVDSSRSSQIMQNKQILFSTIMSCLLLWSVKR